MERYLDGWGPAGRIMMCSTASVQVNVEAGVHPASTARPGRTGASCRRSAHAGTCCTPSARPWWPPSPTPRAAPAGRPDGRAPGRPSGWTSIRPGSASRRADPARSLPAAWARWALDAPLMMIRRTVGILDGARGIDLPDLAAAGTGGGPRPATGHHRRPRLPPDDPVSAGQTEGLPRGQVHRRPARPVVDVSRPPSSLRCWTTTRPPRTRATPAPPSRVAGGMRPGSEWTTPNCATAADRILQVAAAALHRRPDHGELAGQVEDYLERWTARGRCPADDPPQTTNDQIDHQRAGGRTIMTAPINLGVAQELNDDQIKGTDRRRPRSRPGPHPAC